MVVGILFPPMSAAQVVEVGPDRPLGPADPGTAFTEPVIATHPDDASRLAVVAIAGFTRAPGAPGWHCVTWQSHDGGSAWDRRQRVRVSDHPILLWTADGLVLVSTATRRTTDGLASGLLVMRSTDGGESFEVQVELVESDARANAITPADLGAGDVLHGGMTFMELGGGRPRLLDQATLWTSRETREGLAPAVVVGHSCQTRVGFATLTGGPDRSYAVCVGPGARDVLVYASQDGGRSWSGPRGVLGGDGPLLASGASIQRSTPVLRRAVGAAVNRDGVLGVVWQDRQAHPRRTCQRLLFAASRDGGRTFTPPATVSTEDSCPANPANREAGRQWPGGTDSVAGSPCAARNVPGIRGNE